MTKRILIFLFILSVSLYPQKVNVEVDEFTGEKNISTSWEKVVWSMEKGIAIYSSFSYINNKIMLECAFMFNPGTAIIVASETPLRVKFNNDDIIELLSRNYAITTIGGARVAKFFASGQSPGMHVRYTFDSKEDAELFMNNLISFIRFSFNSSQGLEYMDITIKEAQAKKLQKTYAKFKEELDKLNVASN